MDPIIIRGKHRNSTIQVGEQIEKAQEHIGDAQCFVITDSTVKRLYSHRFPKHADIIEIGIGERHKTLTTAISVYEKLVNANADRTAYLFGIGGGVVCDVTGFIGSTYLRGIRFGFAPTTLLAQVDASVGGKNGVNVNGYKNIIGVFNQPEFVICDPSVIGTLTKRDICCGFSEIIKNALIADANLFEFLELNVEKVLSLNHDTLEHLVYRSVKIKAMIVSQDETESGNRKKLNFGHTAGHAIEKVLNIPHGEAVAMGMSIATKLSTRKGLLQAPNADRISRVIAAYGHSRQIKILAEDLLSVLKMDKKRIDNHIHFILLNTIGSAVIYPLLLNDSDLITILQDQEDYCTPHAPPD